MKRTTNWHGRCRRTRGGVKCANLEVGLVRGRGCLGNWGLEHAESDRQYGSRVALGRRVWGFLPVAQGRNQGSGDKLGGASRSVFACRPRVRVRRGLEQGRTTQAAHLLHIPRPMVGVARGPRGTARSSERRVEFPRFRGRVATEVSSRSSRRVCRRLVHRTLSPAQRSDAAMKNVR